jgi:hypothetical protein
MQLDGLGSQREEVVMHAPPLLLAFLTAIVFLSILALLLLPSLALSSSSLPF